MRLDKLRKLRAAKGLPSNLNVRDLVGKRFNKLKVLKFVEIRNKASYWLCLCDCGNTTTLSASKLGGKDGQKSCGCLQLVGAMNSKKNLRHGRYKTPEYYAWSDMKSRCLQPKDWRYPHWGGRGITICQSWIESFEAFFADMGLKPTPQHSLDRVDNNGNYEPSNCRWATAKEQANNRRNNRS